MNKTALTLQGVSQHFVQGDTKISILKNANLTINKGEMTALIGPSGAGKSTLLNIAGMLEDAASGDVFVNGKNISQMRSGKKAAFRRPILALCSRHIAYFLNSPRLRISQSRKC